VEWASLAAYEQVLNRPSLAMSRDAIFFYLHRRFVDPGAAWIEADYRWRQLERTPPLPENDAGTDAKTIHAILPTNKIIAWRVLAAPEVADLSQGKPLADVRGRLEEELKLLYKETPFEFVFQALYNCCGKLLAEKGGPDPARGAEGWRYQRSGQGLRDWIGEWAPPSKLNEWLRGNGQESSTSRINISFRRAIYMFRYLQRVTDADIAFMREVCSVASGAKNGMQALAAGQLEDRVLGTLRGLKPVIDSSPISSDNYAWISDELAREDRDRRDLQKQMADLWEMANSDLELLLEEFIHSDKFTLHQLFSNQGELRRMLCLSHSDDWHERLRGICEIELAKAQSREAPKLGKGTTKALCELEGRILLLVTLLTTSHRLRMFFLPPHYSMREVDLDEPPRKYFDHDGGFLKLLFNGAKLGLRQEGSIGEQDRVDLPAGEFQTYDLYVRAIWMLLREDPFTLS
jgi:hypothetical protein